jgi:hypothetical protein
MKIKNIKYVALAAVFGMGATSCDDFLDRPTEDNYNQSNFYQNDTQLSPNSSNPTIAKSDCNVFCAVY